MEAKYLVNLGAAFIPVIIGIIWYHPKTLGQVVNNSGGKESSMSHTLLVLALTYVCGYFIARSLGSITIHQYGILSMLANQPDLHTAGTQLNTTVQGLLDKYEDNYRTFKHGALHGSLTGVYLVFPILAVVTLFERKKWTFLAVHAIYWIICLALMGGVVCAYMPIHFQLAK